MINPNPEAKAHIAAEKLEVSSTAIFVEIAKILKSSRVTNQNIPHPI